MRRLAVWSGPRNLSTALMRSFAARADSAVSDEPFYAAYLAESGLEHPGRGDVLASQPQDWRTVARQLSRGPAPLDRPVWYQKQMAQHMREEMLGNWLDELDHAFLVRHPARVIASYLKVFPAMTLAETGLPWQVRLFDHLRATRGTTPTVIDAADIRRSPEASLRQLCRWLPAARSALSAFLPRRLSFSLLVAPPCPLAVVAGRASSIPARVAVFSGRFPCRLTHSFPPTQGDVRP